MSGQHTCLINAQPDNDIELGSVRRVTSFHFSQGTDSAYNSARSSLDESYYEKHHCDVHIHDDVPINAEADPENLDDEQACHRTADSTRIFPFSSDTRSTGTANIPERFRALLKNRDPMRSRWINIVGWSGSLIDEIAKYYLGNHGCLDLGNVSKQMLGGPTRAHDGNEFIWLQTQIWFVGQRTPLWSSLRQAQFRMILCLPTATHAGTLITNFVGPLNLAEEISNICTASILENHPLGRQALSCVWVLAFAILRTMAEQLDFAFEIFDPTDSSPSFPSIPQINGLPAILEKANRLSRIDRYLSSLEEFSSFFISVHTLFQTGPEPVKRMPQASSPFLSARVIALRTLEAEKAKNKILHEQRLCKTYMKQFDTLVQMVISHHTTIITSRLERGNDLAEQFAKLGMLVATITGVIAPLSLLTSFYGMNVQEFSSGATASLFDFWQVGFPLILLTAVGFVVLTVWMMTSPSKR